VYGGQGATRCAEPQGEVAQDPGTQGGRQGSQLTGVEATIGYRHGGCQFIEGRDVGGHQPGGTREVRHHVRSEDLGQ
jgi:hypothetical protein